MYPSHDKPTTNWQPKPTQSLLINCELASYLAHTIKLLFIFSAVTASNLQAAENLPSTRPHTSEVSTIMSATEIQNLTLEYAQHHFVKSYSNDADNSRVEVSAARLDPRLKLSRCSQPLEFEPQNSNPRAGRVLVKLRCTGQKPWAIYVPLNIQIWKTVVTATRPLRRGDNISQKDVTLREVKLKHTSAHYLTQLEHAIGQVLTRDTAEASPLASNYLKKPKLVKRGDNVLIVTKSGSVSVEMMGTALADGEKNQQIAVRNQHSERIIKARVIERGKVQVGS